MIKYLSLYERMKSDCSCAMSSKSIINIWLKRPNVLVLRRLLILLSFKTMVIKVSIGLDQKAIHERKGLKKSQKILDYMGSTELAANLFRATQTEEKLRRDAVDSKQLANKTHYDVGQKVRQTIKDLGGTMPEALPSPEKSIQQLTIAAKNKNAPE